MLGFLVIVPNISAFTFVFILVGHFLTLKTACDELGSAMDVVLLQGSRAPSPAAGWRWQDGETRGGWFPATETSHSATKKQWYSLLKEVWPRPGGATGVTGLAPGAGAFPGHGSQPGMHQGATGQHGFRLASQWAGLQ